MDIFDSSIAITNSYESIGRRCHMQLLQLLKKLTYLAVCFSESCSVLSRGKSADIFNRDVNQRSNRVVQQAEVSLI